MSFRSIAATSVALLSLSAFSQTKVAPKAPAPKISENRSRFEQLELFNKVLHLVETQYYRPVSTEKLIEGALKGMMDTLDPHSAFLNKDYFEKMQNDTQGEFGGLGLEVTQRDGVIYIITPIEILRPSALGFYQKTKWLRSIMNQLLVCLLSKQLKKCVEKSVRKFTLVLPVKVLKESNTST